MAQRFDAAVRRAMAKEARDRFPTMDAFLAELEGCLADLDGAESTLRRPVVRARHVRRRVPAWPIASLLAGVAVILVIAGYLSVHDTGGSPKPGPSSGATVSAPVALTATAFDPYGTGGENDAEARFATDGNPATAWETEHYFDAPRLGKLGVGLILDPGSTVQLHTLRVQTTTPGFKAEIRASDTRGHFRDVVSGLRVVGADTTFTIGGRPHRYYLLWITLLGPGFQTAKITEITAR